MSAPNYKDTNVSGTTWTRACRVFVENPLNGTPSIMFVEEKVINLDNAPITQPIANLSCGFDPEATFPGLDPTTGQPVGRDITHAEVYGLLYSLYMDLATKRDQLANTVTP